MKLKIHAISILVILLLVFWLTPVYAAENSISGNVLYCPFKMYQLDYERSLGEKAALNCTMIYYPEDSPINALASAFSALPGLMFGQKDIDITRFREYGCTIGGKWYFSQAQSGVYVGLNGMVMAFEAYSKSYRDTEYCYGLGPSFGFRKVIRSGFTYDFGINPVYILNKGNSGTITFITVNLGYGW